MTPSTRCTIIAEAGVNHNGSLALALELIGAAKAAGADVVKFQTFRADALVTASAEKAAYQSATTGEGSQLAMLRRLELPPEAFRTLAEACAAAGIGFMSTPFDIESARFLAGLGVSAIKVSSGDLTDGPFLAGLARLGLPIILSSGMANLGEVEAAVELLEAGGRPLSEITLLHCTTEYPAPIDEVNLRAMLTLGAAFPGATVGYSDHTEGLEVSFAAAALGAGVIEKHFTLDRGMEGPDHRASLEPAELKALVDGVRRIGRALGDGRKRPTASELPNRSVARKSIVAARPIRSGETFLAENLAARRPGGGLSPMRWAEVIGRAATRDYDEGEPI